MLIDLTHKVWCVVGNRGKGKSTLSKTIPYGYGDKALYYDTLKEVPASMPYHSYKPKNAQDVQELISVILTVKAMPIDKRYKMLVIDEANRFCLPKPHPLPQEIADMNDWCRHPEYDLSVGFIARRPVQLNTDIMELADYIFIFQLSGINDRKYLDSLSDNLGTTVMNLKPFHFVLVNPDRSYTVMNPITPPDGVIGSDTRRVEIK